MAVIRCENVSLGYEGKNIINNISFSLSGGDYLCIVGENGSGKTTLMKGLLGFIKPYSGKITLEKSKIGYLPQQTGIQRDFPVTVNEVILSGCLGKHRFNPFYTKKDRELANAMAEKLELGGLKNKCYQELSGGQQQRAFLARALAQEAHILLLDEPFTGLDVPGTESLAELLRSLAAEGRLIIASHHDLSTADKIFDQTLLLNRTLIATGRTAEVLSEENLFTAFGKRNIVHTS